MLAATASLALAACGSAVPPDTASLANGFADQDNAAPAANVGGTEQNQLNAVGVPIGSSQSQVTNPAPGVATSAAPQPGSGGASNGNGLGTGTGAGQSSQRPGTPAQAGPPVGNCAGFSNGKGITDTQINIANISDLSGPVPGLFKSAQDATKAFVAYFNATVPGGICGRRLNLMLEDSQTSEGGDQAASIDACGKAFALVGSMSAFDAGGAATTTNCGIPDLRAIGVTTARYHAVTSYSAEAVAPNLVPSIEPAVYKRLYPDAVGAAAILYLNAGSAVTNGKSFKAAFTKAGFTYIYEQTIDVTELSYDSEVNAMYTKGVKYIQYTGAYQNAIKLAKSIAIKEAGDPRWKPVFQMDSVAYDPAFVASGGAAVENTLAYTTSGLFEQPTAEMQLYLQWLQRVSPGSTPSFFGQFAWSASRLFADEALALGGRLSRKSLLQAVAGVHNWTSHGLHAPQDVGGRVTTNCVALLQLRNSRWVNVGGGTPYRCAPLIDSGIGG